MQIKIQMIKVKTKYTTSIGSYIDPHSIHNHHHHSHRNHHINDPLISAAPAAKAMTAATASTAGVEAGRNIRTGFL